jgi:hypothetical protein
MLVANGEAVDPSVHGEALATLIGEDCLALEGAFQNATLSLTKKGREEMARSAERHGGELGEGAFPRRRTNVLTVPH